MMLDETQLIFTDAHEKLIWKYWIEYLIGLIKLICHGIKNSNDQMAKMKTRFN